MNVKNTEITFKGNDIHVKCDGNDIHIRCEGKPRWMINSSHPDAVNSKWQQTDTGHWQYLPEADNSFRFYYRAEDRPLDIYSTVESKTIKFNTGIVKSSQVVHKQLPNNYGTVIKVDGNLVWYQNKHTLFVRPSNELELMKL